MNRLGFSDRREEHYRRTRSVALTPLTPALPLSADARLFIPTLPVPTPTLSRQSVHPPPSYSRQDPFPGLPPRSPPSSPPNVPQTRPLPPLLRVVVVAVVAVEAGVVVALSRTRLMLQHPDLVVLVLVGVGVVMAAVAVAVGRRIHRTP